MAPGSSLKKRSGRLQVFARGLPDGESPQEIPSTVQEAPEGKQKPEAHISSAPQTREEAIESARVPIPKTTRPPANHNHPPNASKYARSRSPQKRAPGSPRKTSDETKFRPSQVLSPGSPARSKFENRPRRTIFEGSQLGDNFLDSGFTTPRNEREEAYDEGHLTEDDGKDAGRNAYPKPKDVRDRLYQAPQGRNHDIFQMGENGFITIKSTADRADPSYMRDGFQTAPRNGTENYQNGRGRRDPSADRHTKLAIREVKIRRLRDSGRDFQPIQEKPRSPSPERVSPERVSPPRWLDDKALDEISESEMGAAPGQSVEDEPEPEPEETPRPKKIRPFPIKELMESALPQPTISQGYLAKSKKRHRASPDYDDMALSSKTFADLQNEPFDFDPSKAILRNGHRNNGDDLSTNLEQFKHQAEKDQEAFFSNMSMNDWEESGDWFVDQFADIMKRLKIARREKRQMIEAFEAEAAARERLVRCRSDAIDLKLEKMKHNGQRVIGGQDF
ncbi:unnamed protein product [Clonostachys chloroleuca]|uniref:Extracellular mutant protein 11 C-terminal domain-containing protein n=1 Tax=Clonostachys chloroleuca TaxID=1926264 RepID=A0AA35M3F6_9HYPO|nr:unnamed protein product [Clonostachys chloroleuca]